MESLVQTINTAVAANDYGSLATVFGGGPSSWMSLGSGEQKSLAAHLVSSIVGSPNFLPKALASEEMMEVMIQALGQLPTTVEGAADNKLRQAIFDYKVNEESDYAVAARVLSAMRMESDITSVYFTSPEVKCDVYVKIAECFLEEDEIVEADSAVTKAGSVVESIANPEQSMALILRYKSTYARILDANRKFLQAASRYHDLSQSSGELIQSEDLLAMLGRAATCAVLAPSGPQRQRVLGHIFNDSRISQLETIPQFETHPTILQRMYKNQIIGKDELTKFESTLAPHQKAIMGDGLTILERGVVEHNMIAVSKIYQSIYLTELAVILRVSPLKSEKIAANMIMDGSLHGSIDQVTGVVEFLPSETAHETWDKSISGFCLELNRVTDLVRTS